MKIKMSFNCSFPKNCPVYQYYNLFKTNSASNIYGNGTHPLPWKLFKFSLDLPMEGSDLDLTRTVLDTIQIPNRAEQVLTSCPQVRCRHSMSNCSAKGTKIVLFD